jgi:tetratricopeptide (TPR) repeat protein
LYSDFRGYDPGQPLRAIHVLAVFLRALGVPAARMPNTAEEASALYRSLLWERRMLIVLDNCASADQVRPLLPGTGTCAVVITSRDRLGGLVAKHGAARVALGPFSHAEAMALFAAIGRNSIPPDEAGELASLCGHLPLAMRIAAANLDNDPHRDVADYVARLRDGNRLALLRVEGDSDSSVQAALDQSYRALPAPRRRLFRMLGLIPGADFTADAVAAITGVPVATARQELDRLSNVHLLDQHAPGRFALHDLLRLYAAACAGAEDDAATRKEALQRLYHWYLRTAETAVALFDPVRRSPGAGMAGSPVQGPELAVPADAVAWLEAERANLTDAVVMAERHGQADQAWRLPQVLWPFFFTRGHFRDWIDTHEIALGVTGKLGDRHAQAETLRNLGLAYWSSGQPADALDRGRRALALAVEDGDRHGEAKTLNMLGYIAERTGRADEALEYQQRSARLCNEVNDGWGEARSTIGIGDAYRHLGQHADSMAAFERALELARGAGDLWAEGMALAGIGFARARLGHPAEAMPHLDRALALLRSTGDLNGESLGLVAVGFAHLFMGQPAEAMSNFQRTLSLAGNPGGRWTECVALLGTGYAHLLAGQFGQAEQELTNALARARSLGDQWGQNIVLVALGDTCFHSGRHAAALDRYSNAATLARAAGHRSIECDALNGSAGVYAADGHNDRAVTHYQDALTLALRINDPSQAARARNGLARLDRA